MLTSTFSSMRYCISILLLLFALTLASTDTSFARDMESETNDSFATAQVLSAGTNGVEGSFPSSFDPFSPDAMVAIGRLDPGIVNSHLFSTNMANTPFVAYIDNARGSSAPDTVLQALDEDLNTIAVDDDSSPLGNGLGSLVSGATGSDGLVRLEVSGYNDFNFDGLQDGGNTGHQHAGPYGVYVQAGVDAVGDVDFYTINNLEPASLFQLEMITDEIFPILAQLNASGNTIFTNFSNGDGLFYQLFGVVPRSGTVHLAISGYSDFGLNGSHTQSGDYFLDFQIQIPEPSSVALCSFVIGILCGVRRRANT